MYMLQQQQTDLLQQQQQLDESVDLDSHDNDDELPVEKDSDDYEVFQPEPPSELCRFLLRMSLSALMHPFEYAKVLMQLGHEPLPATVGKNLLGKPTIYLPSFYQYLGYMKRIDGMLGLYRGLAARVLSCASSSFFAERFMNCLLPYRAESEKGRTLGEFAWNLLRNGLIVSTGVLVSHPFNVISVRQMASVVGGELAYTSFKGSVQEIFKQSGLRGFYVGFVPHLVYDLAVLVLTSSVDGICQHWLPLKPEQRQYNSALLQFAAVLLFYPLQVVSTCMCCSGSGMAAGAPPCMPIYAKWSDCLMDLLARGQHNRGAFIYRRTLPKMYMS
ncbi:Mtch [Drosophila busckii]|uniref:Mtch n=1 Tax=Drosophila busckii TaxID=30019 RepID=A0A0M4EWB4_DROBS|nr:mitochondrial carrier homolog 2 [Drosophila busckii]ALC49722.1 Mtch [Drosophila busckii]